MATAAPAAATANKAELLAIADAVAREKLIDKGIVIEAMEDAIQRAARARYGAENDIRAKLDPNTGDLRLWRVLEVVEEVDDYFKQVDLKGAQTLELLTMDGDDGSNGDHADWAGAQIVLSSARAQRPEALQQPRIGT